VLHLKEGIDGRVGITTNTKFLGQLTANRKKFCVTVKINKWIKIYTKIEKMAFFRLLTVMLEMCYTAWRYVTLHYGPKGTVNYSDHIVKITPNCKYNLLTLSSIKPLESVV